MDENGRINGTRESIREYKISAKHCLSYYELSQNKLV
jgi:hypothetical protein